MTPVAYPAVKKLTADVLAADGCVCFGCTAAGGRIKSALTPERVDGDCPSGVYFGAFLQPSGRLLVRNEEGFYYSEDGRYFMKSQAEIAAEAPFAYFVSGGETVVAGDVQCVVTDVGGSVIKPFDGNISGGVFKNGRLFGIDRDNHYIVRWSCKGGLDFEERIDGAGWVEVNADRGEIQNLVVYGQKIVLLCAYGLAELTAYGMPENFKLRYIDGATGEIYRNTAAVAGGKLVFLTRNGLFAYDGAKIEKLDIPVFDDLENPVCSAGSENLYLLAADSKKLARRAVFVADVIQGAGFIEDVAASVIIACGEIHFFSDDGHYVLKRGGEYVFESGAVDFGTGYEKVLESIHLGNSKSVEIKVESGGKTRIFAGVRGYCRPRMRGKSFKITVRGKGDVSGVNATAEVWNGI